MKNLLFILFIFSYSAVAQETLPSVSNGHRELNEKAEKFFFENLIGNKQNKNFKSVLIGDRLYDLNDSLLLQKHPEYAYFKRPSGDFLKSFTTFLMNDLFKTNDAKVLKNIHYSLPFSSSELYGFYVIKEGLKIDNYTLQIATPFNESLYKKEIKKIHFNKNGLIDKVEELVETNYKPDTLLLNRLTTYTYSKGILIEKIIEHKNIHTGQQTQVDSFLFDKYGKLKEVKIEKYNYRNEAPEVSKSLTLYKYNNGNLTEIKTSYRDKVISSYSINYENNRIEVNPLDSCYSCVTFNFLLKK